MADLPQTKYRFEFSVDANSHDEIFAVITDLATNYGYRIDGRDYVDIVSSDRTVIRLRTPKPEQTPSGYASDLQAWMKERRAARNG